MIQSAPAAGQPATFLVALGERLHDLGGDGIAFLARVNQTHPDDFWAALTLARASYERADRTATDAAYRRALDLREKSATVYNNLGVVACSMSRWSEAADHCRKSLEIDPSFAPAHHNLGLALKGQGKWSEAVQQFREAIRLGPDLAPPHYHLGEIRAFVGELDEAIAEYRQALRIDPEFARAEYMLGVALAGRGWLDEAHDRDHRAVRLDPVRARAQKKIRDIAMAQGISHYKRAIRIDPGLNLCGNNVGLTPGDADRLKEAIGHYETAIRFDPWFLIAHAARGQALLALGRFRDAEAVTRRCLNRMHDGHEWRSNVVALLGAASD